MEQKNGFTLVELVIVVIVIGILAAVAVPNFMKQLWKARMGACKNNMKIIYDAAYIKMTELGKDITQGNLGRSDFAGGKLPSCPVKSSYSVTGTISNSSVIVNCGATKTEGGGYAHGAFNGSYIGNWGE
jgi:prepilin-type N-terminal cleavage/methylation domain-containing protein